MRVVLLALLLCIILAACTGNKPRGLIPADKMKVVLSDLYIAESYSTMVNDSLHRQVNRNPDSLASYYKSILAHHSITMEELTNSIEWYKKNPEQLDSVYAKILPDLSKVQATHPAR